MLTNVCLLCLTRTFGLAAWQIRSQDGSAVAARRLDLHLRVLAASPVVGLPDDGISVPFVPAFPEQHDLDSVRELRAATNTWVKTPQGFVHYRLYNGEAQATEQPLCVMVHGFSIGGVKHFSALAQEIASRGVPVLTLDLFGRGLSDRLAPPARYDAQLYTACLRDTLLGLREQGLYGGGPVDILGFSMGGRIIQHFSLSYPEMVRRMIFYEPDGTRTELLPSDVLAKVREGRRAHAEALMGSAPSSWEAYYKAQYRRIRAYNVSDELFKSMVEGIVQDAEVEFSGFAYALGSSLVDFMYDDADSNAARLEAVGRLRKPSIVLWSTADTDVPYSQHKGLLKYIPQCVLHTYEGECHMFFQKAGMAPVVAQVVAEFVLPGKGT